MMVAAAPRFNNALTLAAISVNLGAAGYVTA
jgi:hypothetical protein